MSSISNFASLVKFSHTIFALPFALIGFTLGLRNNGNWHWWQLLLVLLCMVTARNAAMAFNRYIDNRFDKLNPRTAVREIPAGKVSASAALLFVVINCIIFCAAAYLLQPLCGYLSLVALVVILGYSYTKRFTALCHLVLGAGLSLAPIGAYMAVTGASNWQVIILGVIVLTWVAGFDIIYALQDADFDKVQQLHSIPAAVGIKKSIHISTTLHCITAALVIYIGTTFHSNLYWVAAVLFIACLVYQHWLVKPSDLSKINMAFFTLNGIASVCYGVLVILSTILPY